MQAVTLAVALAVVAPFLAAQDRIDCERIPVLLITGENNHDWNWTSESLRTILEESGRFAVTMTDTPAKTLADAEALRAFRAFVLDYNGASWGEPANSNFLAAVRGGTGVVVVHAADNAFPGWKEYEELVGLLWRDGTGHGRFHLFDVEIDDADHPITAGMRSLIRHPDELYHRLVNVQGVDNRVLGSAFSDPETGGTGNREPMIIVRSFGDGRVFHTPLGHVWRNVPQSHASHSDPQFRRLVARGTEWAATGAVTLAPIPPNWVSPEEREAGFRALFDGRSLDGWSPESVTVVDEGCWLVDRASLHWVGGPPGVPTWLVTDASHQDFELRLEWATGGDGGLLTIPRVDPESPSAPAEAPLHLIGAAGVFHAARILVEDGAVRCWIDDVPVDAAEVGKSAVATGRLAIRSTGCEVWIRSIRLRPIGQQER